MKKAILIFALMLITGCSTEDSSNAQQCECNVQTWTKYYVDGVQTQDWQFTNDEYDYSENCEDNGIVTDGETVQDGNITIEFQYRVKCN